LNCRWVLLLAFLPLFAFPSTLSAQAKRAAGHDPNDRVEIFGEYSYVSMSDSYVLPACCTNGWDAGASVRVWHGLSAKSVLTGYAGNQVYYPGSPALSESAIFYLFGAQYAVRFGRESVFIEELIGGVHLSSNQPVDRAPSSFSNLVGGGFDTRVTSHFAVRVGGGVLRERFIAPGHSVDSPTLYPRLSAGLVVRF
jgi:hypothetical protein